MSNDIPDRDELRRQLRSLGTPGRTHRQALRRTAEATLSSDVTAADRAATLLGRRRFLHLGGTSVATAAVLAACGGTDSPGIAKIGSAPTTTQLPDAVVNDVVLLRTASSLEHTAISIYELVIDNADLLDPIYRDLAARFRDDHAEHAALVEQLTVEAGGEAWTCGNPRLDELVVPAILKAITGDETSGLAPSDDPRRDVLNVAQAFESLAGSTYQALMPVLSLPVLRKDAISIASQEVRHAAILSIALTGRPAGYMNPDEIAAATGQQPVVPESDVPPVYAIPGQFGNLGATELIIGAPNEIGNRVSLNVETPSLNSLVYEYLGTC
jgi:hypothetical protein